MRYSFLIVAFACLSTSLAFGQNQQDPDFFLDTQKGQALLEKFFTLRQKFIVSHNGKYPTTEENVLSDLYKNPAAYGFADSISALKSLVNPDNKYSENKSVSRRASAITIITPYVRDDGSPIGSPLKKGERDLIAYTSLYVRQNQIRSDSNVVSNPSGDYLALWSDGEVERVPYDQILWEKEDKGYAVAFRGQAGLKPEIFSEEELGLVFSRPRTLVGKPYVNSRVILDNGGPESLLQFSRGLSFPDKHGIRREDLWKVFDPSQQEFALSDIEDGAKKLGLNIRSEKISLQDLQGIGLPAVLFLSEDARIVALKELDDSHAVIIDRGVTQIIPRSELEKRYSGQALLPANADVWKSGILVEDPVRQIQLNDLDEDVSQQVVIQNTGKNPVSLQFEYPILGVAQSNLSQNTVAPGEKATIDLKIKWRSSLKTASQNVLINVRTNETNTPHLQVAFRLVPPASQNVAK